MSDTDICSIKGCSLSKYEDYSECVLHCSKEKAQKDYHMSKDELVEFRRQLVILIVESEFNNKKMKNIDIELVYKYFGLGQTMKKVPSTLEKTIKDVLQKSTMVFDYIVFPVRKERDDWDYEPILNEIGKIHFNCCKFYLSNLDIKEAKCFFQDCEFFASWYIHDYALLQNQSNVIYKMCNFYEGTSAAEREVKEERLSLTNSQFSDCNFGKELVLEYVDIQAPLFNNGDSFRGQTDFLKVYHCVIDERFAINQYCIETVSFQSSVFKNKFEFRDNCTKEFISDNCNYRDIADYYRSCFENFKTIKGIYEDFCVFEGCRFGKEGVKADKQLRTNFEYVTFKSEVNFRNTKFYDGLDIQHANFTKEPKFLNADIDSTYTSRETFRSIKHSFDSIGNYLDANKYFALEMKKYKEELEAPSSRKQEKILFWFNENISDFGQDYWRPLRVFIYSSLIYFLLYLNLKEQWIYFTNPMLVDITSIMSIYANDFAKTIMPFQKLLTKGMEFIGLIFYIWYSILIWQTIVAVKRHTRR